MPRIIWKGIIKSYEEFPVAELKHGAVCLDAEDDLGKMQLKALPFLIPSVAVCIACILIKTLIAQRPVINVWFLPLGVLAGFLGIIVHELLHAVAYPKDAVVFVGIMPKKFTAVALSSYPVSRGRFVFISVLPVVLGLVPLIAFCFCSPEMSRLNAFLFGAAVMGMTSVYPDFYNVYNVVKKIPKGAIIQNSGIRTYYYLP